MTLERLLKRQVDNLEFYIKDKDNQMQRLQNRVYTLEKDLALEIDKARNAEVRQIVDELVDNVVRRRRNFAKG